MKKFVIALLALLVVQGVALAGPPATQGASADVPATQPANTRPGWKLVWADEFDTPGLPDPRKWVFEEGFVRNNESQYYTKARKENCRVEDGALVIEARKEQFPNPRGKPANYTSASIHTLGKASWTYGRIEMQAKLPQGMGVWPAFWTLGNNIASVGWPACGEIDIMEFVGKTPDKMFGTLHWKHGGHQQKGGNQAVKEPWADFHVYAVEWSADKIDFLFDDTKYNSIALSTADDGANNAFKKPHHLKLNLALGGSWGGKIDDSVLPQRFVVNYVRVYEKMVVLATQPAATAKPAGEPVLLYGIEDRANRVAYLFDKTDFLKMPYTKLEIVHSIKALRVSQQLFIATYCEFTEFTRASKSAYVPATDEDKRAAAKWVEEVHANSWQGQILPDKALDAAFKAEGGPPDVIFLVTDSMISKATLDRVAAWNRGRKTRIHTILVEAKGGEESSKELAEQNGGRYRFISKEDLDEFVRDEDIVWHEKKAGATTQPGGTKTNLKGWEIYIWQDKGETFYALLLGTNRAKAAAEIGASAVTGLDPIKRKLDELKAGESVWISGRGPEEKPPAEQADAIVEYGKKIGLKVMR